MTEPVWPTCRNCVWPYVSHRRNSDDYESTCQDFTCVVHTPEMNGSTGYCSVCGKRVDQ